MIHSAQKFVDPRIHIRDPLEGLIEASLKTRGRISMAQQHISSSPSKKRKNISSVLGKAASSAPSPKKQKSSDPRKFSGEVTLKLVTAPGKMDGASESHGKEEVSKMKRQRGKYKLSHAKIVSTASAKLTYLMDQISLHHTAEKILVFYESDNTAFYIAQALECIGVNHLIYAKSLNAQRRAQYVVTFNQSDVFRVLLMDVSQAAFGLDMSSASRVYFVNPVFSPQIEVQAVKRAHRIGQTKPVFVQTLVLKGSIEEVMMRRRAEMSSEQHTKCKSLLDDEVMYDWVRNVDASRFFHIKDVPEPEQMAKLKVPQMVFGRGVEDLKHADQELIFPRYEAAPGVVDLTGEGDEKGKEKSDRGNWLEMTDSEFSKWFGDAEDDWGEEGDEEGHEEADEDDHLMPKEREKLAAMEKSERFVGTRRGARGGWADIREPYEKEGVVAEQSRSRQSTVAYDVDAGEEAVIEGF